MEKLVAFLVIITLNCVYSFSSLSIKPQNSLFPPCSKFLSSNKATCYRLAKFARSKLLRDSSPLLSLKAVIDFDDIEHVVLRGGDGKSNMPDNWSLSGVYACFDRQGVMQYVAMSRKVASSIEAHLQVVGPDCHSAKAVVWDKPTKAELEDTARAWIEKCVATTGDAPPGNTPDVQIWRMKPSEARRAKQNLQFQPGSKAEDAEGQIRSIVGAHPVVLFMKGTRQAPQASASQHQLPPPPRRAV